MKNEELLNTLKKLENEINKKNPSQGKINELGNIVANGLNELLEVDDIEFENKPSKIAYEVDGEFVNPLVQLFKSNEAVKPMYGDEDFKRNKRVYKKPIIGLNRSKRRAFIINPHYNAFNEETGEQEFLRFYNEAFDTNKKLATCIKNAKVKTANPNEISEMLQSSDFIKDSAFKWFNVQGSMVTTIGQPVLKEGNINYTRWHEGLLTGHAKFKFDGESEIKIKTISELNEFTHLIKMHNEILETLEAYVWKDVNANQFGQISTWDAYHPKLNLNYVKRFKRAIERSDVKNALAKFDKDIVELILNNIVSENKTMGPIYKKMLED